MVFDFTTGTLLMSMTDLNRIAQIKVLTGETTYIDLNGPAVAMDYSEQGILFAMSPTELRRGIVRVIDTGSATVVSSTPYNDYNFQVYDQHGNNLILGEAVR